MLAPPTMPRSPKPPLPARQPPVAAEPAPEDEGGEVAAGADEPFEFGGEPVESALELPEAGDGDDGAEAAPAPLDEPAPATAKRSLARFDPLTQYINEIRRYPLLSRE